MIITVTVKELVLETRPKPPEPPADLDYWKKEEWRKKNQQQLVSDSALIANSIKELANEISKLERQGYTLSENPFKYGLSNKEYPDKIIFRMELEDQPSPKEQVKKSPVLDRLIGLLEKTYTTPEENPESHFDEVRSLTPEQINERFGISPMGLLAGVDERDGYSHLELSVRTYNCLRNAGIFYAGEVAQLSENTLLRTKNMGRRSINELKDVLSDLNLEIGMKIPIQVIAWCKIQKPDFKHF